MYIECQQCDTTFRLDESLLKPTGSKVRCSQCGNVFVALPPSAVEPAPIVQEPAAPTATPDEQEPAPVQPPTDAPELGEEKGEEVGLQDVDLAELDTLFAQDQEIPAETAAPAAETEETEIAAELDESDLEIDFEAVLEADDSIVAAPAEEPVAIEADEGVADDLDLELDFDLESDLAAEEATPQETGEVVSEDEFELALDDVDLDAGGDTTVFSDMEPLGPAEEGEADLGIDQDATIFVPPEESGGDEEISDLDIDLESDLDLEIADDTKAAAPEAAEVAGTESEPMDDVALNDDFFSDLDSILDESKLEGSDEAETKEEVELELADESDEAAPAEQSDADADLEELDFELDAEYEDKPIAQADESEPSLEIDDDEAGEIDLSEIELMLEGDSDMGIASTRTDEEKAEKTAADDDFDLGIQDEIDLSELTMAIEQADLTDAGDTATIAEDELDLALSSDEATDDVGSLAVEGDLELESPEPSTVAGSLAGDELDLSDLSDLDDLGDLAMEKPPAPEPDIVDTGDIELEFQIEEEEETAPQVQEHLDTMTPDLAPEIDQALEMPETVEELEETKPVKRPKPKKKSSKLFLVILILILLGAIGYGIYYADTEMGIKIPYISDVVSYVREYVAPKPKDPLGTVNLSTLEINSKFIENEQSGRLFVITGKVHNGYQQGHGQIRLEGKLFTKGKVLAQTESVFAGKILSDGLLATLPFAEIKKELSTPPQTGTPGAKVLPNQNLGFMVVFSNLPPADNLEEFAVEVVRSLAIQ